MRETERQRQTETEAERQTETQTERQRQTDRDRQTPGQLNGESHCLPLAYCPTVAVPQLCRLQPLVYYPLGV